VKNLNDRIYTKENVDKIIKDFTSHKNAGVYGRIGYSTEETHDISKSSHRVNYLELMDDVLVAKMETLDTKYGEALEEKIKEGSVVFRTRCAGTINEDNTVNITDFFSVDAIGKNEDAYKGILNE
jgi:hypothetical protein